MQSRRIIMLPWLSLLNVKAFNTRFDRVHVCSVFPNELLDDGFVLFHAVHLQCAYMNFSQFALHMDLQLCLGAERQPSFGCTMP